MSTTIADSGPQARIEVEQNDGHDEAVFLGPALQGWVYRSTRQDTWYRLLPVEQTTLKWRHRLSSDTGRLPAAETIAPDRHWQLTDRIRGFLISYPDRSASRSLSEGLQDTEAAARIRCAIAALEALPRWWQQDEGPLFPTPAEMILGEDGRMRLLWIPPSPLPEVAALFADPRRALYLPPELVRGQSGRALSSDRTREAADRYALGVCLLAAFFCLPEVERAETALFRTATGSLLAGLDRRADTPPWLERFATHRTTLALLRRLTSPAPETRRSVDLTKLATQLKHTQDLTDPRVAVARLRDSARPFEALEVLQELFPLLHSLGYSSEVQYDLLLLAGELCAQYLRRPLDALDYFERAIEQEPERRDAYGDQLRLVANVRHHRDLASLIEKSPHLAGELDARIWRNYRALAPNRTTHADDKSGRTADEAMAEYLLWRRQYATACDFIHPRLSDSRGQYVWWDFELNLAYVRALLGLERGDGSGAEKAAEQLQNVKNGLQFVRNNHSIDESVVRQYGDQVAELERRLFDLRPKPTSDGTSTAS